MFTAGLHAKLRSTYHSLCVQAQLFAVSPPVGRNPCFGGGLLGGLNAAIIDLSLVDLGGLIVLLAV